MSERRRNQLIDAVRGDLRPDYKAPFLSDSHYSRTLDTYPIVGVDTVFINRARKTFFLARRKERPAEGQWWFVGGRIPAFKFGSFEDAAASFCIKRETKLELDQARLNPVMFNRYQFENRSQVPVENGTDAVAAILAAELTDEELAFARNNMDKAEFAEGDQLREFTIEEMVTAKVPQPVIDAWYVLFGDDLLLTENSLNGVHVQSYVLSSPKGAPQETTLTPDEVREAEKAVIVPVHSVVLRDMTGKAIQYRRKKTKTTWGSPTEDMRSFQDASFEESSRRLALDAARSLSNAKKNSLQSFMNGIRENGVKERMQKAEEMLSKKQVRFESMSREIAASDALVQRDSLVMQFAITFTERELALLRRVFKDRGYQTRLRSQ